MVLRQHHKGALGVLSYFLKVKTLLSNVCKQDIFNKRKSKVACLTATNKHDVERKEGEEITR